MEMIDNPLHEAAKRGNIDFMNECIANQVLVSWSCNSSVLDWWLQGHGFDFQFGHHQVVITRMGNCLRIDKPSRYITNTKANSAFRPSRVGKSSTGLSGLG